MITLHDCATAPSPRRARILLAEKGVAHETVQVDLRVGEQLGEAYRRINPHCTVPTLDTGEGLLLTDNAAIAAWLEARFPEPPVLYSHGGRLDARLRAAAGPARMGGRTVQAWSYDGSVPGPTLAICGSSLRADVSGTPMMLLQCCARS